MPLGQVQVRHEARIGFVYSHAEGDRGNDDDIFPVQKALLVPPPFGRRQSGVVGQRLPPPPA